MDSKVEARTLGYAGIDAYEAAEYTLAQEKLERAFQLLPVPSLGLWSARALVKTGRLVEAADRYAAVLSLALAGGDRAVQKAAREDAVRERAALMPRIPLVRLEVVGAQAKSVRVSVDGTTIEGDAFGTDLEVNPGLHVFKAARVTAVDEPRSAGRARVLAFDEGDKKTVRLDVSEAQGDGVSASGAAELTAGASSLAGSPSLGGAPSGVGSAPDSPTHAGVSSDVTWRTVGWVAVGVGGSTLLLSAVAGLVAYSKLDGFDCSADPCRSDNADEVEGYDRMVRVSTAAYIVGGLTAASGIWLVLQHGEPDKVLSVGIGAGVATFHGRF